VNDRNPSDWIDCWSAEYRRDWDADLEELAGKDAFSGDDVERVYTWKYRRMWRQKKIAAMRDLAEERVVDLTRRAFSCPDELGALTILTVLPGAGAAGASAMLMARDPARYTVMDVRAIRSLTTLGLWSEQQGTRASCLFWPDYLVICRELASRADRPLRAVDRALWAANGHDCRGG
jgi:hypothetical protein